MFQSRNRESFGFYWMLTTSMTRTTLEFQSRNRESFGFYLIQPAAKEPADEFQSRNRESFGFY